ncbi:MAG: DUF3780 domain-containing protein [Candidatus Accumulibacter meliphilus]|uniref:DUF3780 domain-containing protein n=1 Tax=Candidatus Accumulibacter meliphilus TaxID=2211374 RepID=A0A369XR84_9PROT|nr:MAG: DUF3780 domain-containing protein [Candidatus Accumulibacter meliphilus]
MNEPHDANVSIGAELHDFGIVAEHGDCFEFLIDGSAGASCLLVSVVQTERGPRRTELAEISGATWRKISARAVRELAQDMNADELEGKKAPSLKTGTNRLSPLVGRELALLLWALQEEGAPEQIEAILHGWRELAREERWWLYAKAAAHGQQIGFGWRRALFHALSESTESRAAPPPAEKKSPKRTSSPRSSASTRLKATPPPPAAMPPQTPPRPAARKRKTAAVAMTLK